MMPRQKNTRPTSIYWLIDVRPETIAAGYPNGKPFYCGKTMRKLSTRLYEHKRDANRNPYGKIGPKLLECGEYTRIVEMERVAIDDDWAARERHWIKLIRFTFPDSCNVSDGGDGASGVIRSEEWRQKLIERLTGRKHTPETKAILANYSRGKTPAPSTLKKLSENTKARWQSEEYRKKMTAVSNATWANETKRTEIIAKHKERWKDPVYRAKVTERSKAGRTEKHFSQHAETMRAKWATQEHRDKVAAGKARRLAMVSANV